MGVNVVNDQGPVLHIQQDAQGNPVFLGYYYLRARGNPALHDESPNMTYEQARDVLTAARDLGIGGWVDAHPAPVRTWLLGIPAAERESLYQGSRQPIPLPRVLPVIAW